MKFEEINNAGFWQEERRRDAEQMTIGQLVGLVSTFGAFYLLMALAAILEA